MVSLFLKIGKMLDVFKLGKLGAIVWLIPHKKDLIIKFFRCSKSIINGLKTLFH
ncbi:MAG: hypothetical protein NPMRIOTA_10018 [Nitrosopumilales archaeon]|nr:MAG: hypothetical protein NPMRIOTA_10018 [Nitrosopumilales archaeon]